MSFPIRPWRAIAAMLVALLALLAAATDGLGAAETPIVMSADTAGHVGPCTGCPMVVGQGGLARRATLLDRLRAEHPQLILLDAGHAIWGPESLASEGRVITAAYAELGYDALNLSWRDFRRGLAATRTALEPLSCPILSATLRDAETGEPLFAASTVIERGDQRIAVVGATALPAVAAALPHVGEQLQGIEVADPSAVVPPLVAELAAASDRLVLCFDGDRRALEDLLAALGDVDVDAAVDAVLVSGLRPGELPSDASIPLIATHQHGAALAAWDGAAVTHHHVQSDLEPDAGLRELVASLEPEPTDAAAAPVLRQGLPARLDHGAPVELMAIGEHRGLEIQVLAARVADAYGAAEAGVGEDLLILDTEWINSVAIDLVLDLDQPRATQMPSVPRRCFIEVDGAILRRVDAAGMQAPAALPESFVLPEAGAAERGELVFRIPEDSANLRLHVMHDRFGPLLIDLGPDPLPTADPVGPPVANTALTLGVFGTRRVAELHGQAAPDGSEFLIVDLRGRSGMALDGRARALDAEAPADATARIPVAFEYLHAHELIQLLADGELLCRRVHDLERWDAEPAFVPSAMAGGELVFQVPSQAAELVLSCQFPRFEMAQTAVDITSLAACDFVLAARDPGAEAVPEPPLASMPGEPIAAELVGAREAETVAGQPPPAGRRWVVLRIGLRNGGAEGGMFTLAERCRLDGGDWEALPHEIGARATHAPPTRLWLPADGRRSAELAFAVPADADSAILRLGLVDRAAAVGLRWGDAAGTVVADAEDGDAQAVAAAEQPEDETPAEAGPETQGRAEDGGDDADRAASEDAAPSLADLLGAGREPAGIAAVGLTAQEVNAAIDRGRAFLWRYLREEWGEQRPLQPRRKTHVLAALALVHSEAHREWPDCDAAIRSFIESYGEEVKTYELSLYLMLVRAYGDPRYRDRMRRATIALLNGQGGDGSWGYGAGPWPEQAAAARAVLTVHGGVPLDGSENEPTPIEASVVYDAERRGGDNSVTQFAVLGLRSAEKAGFQLPAAVWERIRDCYLERQDEDDGGWSYHRGGSYGSMTCAGICSLAIARHALGIEPAVGGEALRRGLAYLAEHFDPSTNFNSKKWNFYYRYSYERVGRLLGTDFLGEHEWYPLGAKVLVGAQQADGRWEGGHSDEREAEVATAFALLYLTRATEQLGPERLARGGPGRLATLVERPERRSVHIILDASGSMLAPSAPGSDASRFDRARAAVLELVAEFGSETEVGLRVYGHRKRAIEEGAGEDSELLLPIETVDHARFAAAVEQLKPRGRTPMAFSLRHAIAEARRHGGPVTLLLLTDGGEDPQSAYDPVAEAAAIAESDDLDLEIVGLAIDRADWRDQLRAMAAAADATYWPVAEADRLAPRLRQAVLHVPDHYDLVAADSGEVVRCGRFGDEHDGLPEGRYLLRTSYAGQDFERELWINTDRTTSVVFDAMAVDADPGVVAAAEPAEPAAAPAEPAAPADPGQRPTFCSQCGNELPESGKFCPNCGKRVQ